MRKLTLSSYLLPGLSCLLLTVACDSPKPSGAKSGVLPAYCAEILANAENSDAATGEEEGADTEEKTEAAFRLADAVDAVYDAEVKPILDGKCATAGCHDGAVNPNLTTGQGASDAGIEIIDRAITKRATVPMGGGGVGIATLLDATEIDILETWEAANFPLTFVAETTPETPTWEELNTFFTDKSCLGAGCHTTADKAANLILDTEDGFKAGKDKIIPKFEKGAHFGITLETDTDLKIVTNFIAGLTADSGPTYDVDIKPIMEDKGCLGSSCHSTEGKAASVILDTKTDYDASADQIFKKVDGGGHFSITLDADQLKVVKDYALGLKAAAETPKTETPTEKISTEVEIPEECKIPSITTDKDGDGDGVTASEDKVRSPAKLTECKDEGTLYDRKTKACHEALLDDSFDCDWTGVKTRFDGIVAAKVLTRLETDEAWEVEQCGKNGEDPVVMLLKVDTSKGYTDVTFKTLDKRTK